MVVVRLPHVDMRGERGEQIIVCAYVEIVAAEIVVAAYLADPLPHFGSHAVSRMMMCGGRLMFSVNCADVKPPALSRRSMEGSTRS